jgi:3-methyladenine DNA glycosylase AlkC
MNQEKNIYTKKFLSKIVNQIKKILSLRETKVLDIIADWVTDTFEVDVDEVSIYPTKPSNY